MASDKIEITDRGLRPAQIRLASLNCEARTVDVIWSTGCPVKRFSWDEGEFLESLAMTADAVNLQRLNAGASFLDSHSQTSMANRLGAVVPGSARIEYGKGVATILLSTSKSGEQILADLRTGLPLPVSVGYRVHTYERADGDGATLPSLTATRWEPMEISAVPVPADFGAYARSATDDTQRHTVTIQTARRAENAADKENVIMSQSAIESVAAERQRSAEIHEIGTYHKASPRLMKRALESDMTVPELREAILDEMRARQARNETFSVAPHDNGTNERSLADSLADAILARVKPGHAPNASSRQFAGLPMAEMARAALTARGEATAGVRPSELIGRALHTTSDFSLALSSVANRLVRNGYASAPSQIKRIARETTARDFKAKTAVQFSEAGGLERVNEHGEFKRGNFAEAGETYRIDTFGKIFGLTRKALINDDLDLLARVPNSLGEYASRFESQFLAGLLEAPAKLRDGKALFHPDHGNLAGAGSAISVSSLGAARLALRRQRGIGGEVISVEPKFLLVPPELETTGEQILSDINASKVDDVNPFAGRLELVVEPYLTNEQSWYLAADPAQTALEYAYLEGETGPQIETR